MEGLKQWEQDTVFRSCPEAQQRAHLPPSGGPCLPQQGQDRAWPLTPSAVLLFQLGVVTSYQELG